jgi:hypothetical protein
MRARNHSEGNESQEKQCLHGYALEGKFRNDAKWPEGVYRARVATPKPGLYRTALGIGCLWISKNLTAGPRKGPRTTSARGIPLCARTTYLHWHDHSYRPIGSDYRNQLWATVREPRLWGDDIARHAQLGERPGQEGTARGLTCARSNPKWEPRDSIPSGIENNANSIMLMA